MTTLAPTATATTCIAAAPQGGVRPPLLLGDMLAYPDLAAGIDLEVGGWGCKLQPKLNQTN